MKPCLCQSCGKYFLPEEKGTQRDGTKTDDFCISCYENGEFTDPSLTLHSLEIQYLEMARLHNEISLEEAQQLIKILPQLKRWQLNNI